MNPRLRSVEGIANQTAVMLATVDEGIHGRNRSSIKFQYTFNVLQRKTADSSVKASSSSSKEPQSDEKSAESQATIKEQDVIRDNGV
jgi:hypothetical protein